MPIPAPCLQHIATAREHVLRLFVTDEGAPTPALTAHPASMLRALNIAYPLACTMWQTAATGNEDATLLAARDWFRAVRAAVFHSGDPHGA